MRIISGIYRGRKLNSPKTNDVRPTSDKVKEAVFSMLIPYIDDAVCMDVFAGSGNLGLEALSRGASRVFFSDASRQSIALVKENVLMCGAEDQSVLLSGDFKSNIKRVHENVDIFFVDPPYAAGFIPDVLRTIDEAGNISEGGIVVCEHAKRDKLPEELYGFRVIKDRIYGATAVTIYERIGEEAEEIAEGGEADE